MLKRAVHVSLLAAILISQSLPPALAVDLRFATAVKAYKDHKYQDAVNQFKTIVHADNRNEQAHYYLGLSYMALKQNSLAEIEFNWIIDNGFDRTAIAYSKQQVDVMHGKAVRAYAPRSNQTASVSATATAGASSQAAPQKKSLGRCKVLFFETDWCHYCHEFAPDFEAAKGKYGNKMDFQRVNAEADTGLAQKYGIHSYPRLVYLDGSGNLLYNEGRGGFQSRLKELSGE